MKGKDLTYLGKRKYHGGVMHISTIGLDEIIKQLGKIEDGGKKAIRSTTSEFTQRAPAQVDKGIKQHYGVDNVAVKDARGKAKRGKTTIRLLGEFIDGATLTYQGRTLTLTHFGMKPKKINPKGLTPKTNVIPGQAINFKEGPHVRNFSDKVFATVRRPKPYTISAEIIKGHRKNMPPDTFLASSNNSPVLPFQKDGSKNGRTPVEVRRSLSVPQMIDGKAHDTVYQLIADMLEERFRHNLERYIK